MLKYLNRKLISKSLKSIVNVTDTITFALLITAINDQFISDTVIYSRGLDNTLAKWKSKVTHIGCS